MSLMNQRTAEFLTDFASEATALARSTQSRKISHTGDVHLSNIKDILIPLTTNYRSHILSAET